MTTPATETKRARISIAALWFGVTAPTVYALLRLYEVARGEAIDPVLVIRQVHSAYYFRCALAVWFAAFVALHVFRAPLSLSLTRAAAILVPLATLVAWLAP